MKRNDINEVIAQALDPYAWSPELGLTDDHFKREEARDAAEGVIQRLEAHQLSVVPTEWVKDMARKDVQNIYNRIR